MSLATYAERTTTIFVKEASSETLTRARDWGTLSTNTESLDGAAPHSEPFKRRDTAFMLSEEPDGPDEPDSLPASSRSSCSDTAYRFAAWLAPAHVFPHVSKPPFHFSYATCFAKPARVSRRPDFALEARRTS